MLEKIVTITTVASLCLLIILLNTTVPTAIGPFGILTVFILSYTSSLGVVTYFLFAISRIVVFISGMLSVSRPLKPLTFRRAYYYSTVIAATPIMLVALQSVGAVGVYEVALVVLFTVMGCVYIAKRIR
jgi:hypothetical protein